MSNRIIDLPEITTVDPDAYYAVDKSGDITKKIKGQTLIDELGGGRETYPLRYEITTSLTPMSGEISFGGSTEITVNRLMFANEDESSTLPTDSIFEEVKIGDYLLLSDDQGRKLKLDVSSDSVFSTPYYNFDITQLEGDFNLLDTGNKINIQYFKYDSGGGYSPIENTIKVGKSGGVDFNTITDALNSIGTGEYPTILVYKGIYTEDLTFKENVPIVGIGQEGDVVIVGNQLVDNGDCRVSNITLTENSITDNSYTLRITSDGNLFFRDLILVDNYTGDIQTSALRMEGNSYIKGNTLQIYMNKTGSDNGAKDIKAVSAEGLSSETLSIINAISIKHYSEDINNNLIGFDFGGSAGIHTSNYIFEYETTHADYSGNLLPVVYESNTNPKTLGDMTVRGIDAGDGTLTMIKINATSGEFIVNNIVGNHEGDGDAYIADVATGANLTIGAYNVNGFTDKISNGIMKAYGLFNGVFVNPNDIELGVAGETLLNGQFCAIDGSDGKVYVVTSENINGLAKNEIYFVVGGGAINDPVQITASKYKASSAPDTANVPFYIGDDGFRTTTAPSGSGNIVRTVGTYASNVFTVNIDKTFFEVQ